MSVRLDLLALESEPSIGAKLVIEAVNGTTCMDSRRGEKVPDSSNPVVEVLSVIDEIQLTSMNSRREVALQLNI